MLAHFNRALLKQRGEHEKYFSYIKYFISIHECNYSPSASNFRIIYYAIIIILTRCFSKKKKRGRKKQKLFSF